MPRLDKKLPRLDTIELEYKPDDPVQKTAPSSSHPSIRSDELRLSETRCWWLVVFVIVFAALFGGLRGRLRCAALLVDFARAVGAHSAKTAHALELSSD